MNDTAETQIIDERPSDGAAKPDRKKPRRQMPEISVRTVTGAFREAAYWVARIWFRGVFYSNSLRGRRPTNAVPVTC